MGVTELSKARQNTARIISKGLMRVSKYRRGMGQGEAGLTTLHSAGRPEPEPCEIRLCDLEGSLIYKQMPELHKY